MFQILGSPIWTARDMTRRLRKTVYRQILPDCVPATLDCYLLTSSYRQLKSEPVEHYNQCMKAMLRCYVNGHHQNLYTYASMVMFVYTTHEDFSRITCPFNLVLNWRVPKVTLEFSVFSQKMLAATE